MEVGFLFRILKDSLNILNYEINFHKIKVTKISIYDTRRIVLKL